MRLIQGGAWGLEDRREPWRAQDHAVSQLTERFRALYQQRSFDYLQPVRLQPGVPKRLRKPYAVPVAYTDWGPPDAPLVVCTGGVANTAMRFCFLAADLSRHFRVVCMDWLGRGRSGWLADDSEYSQATYLEQLRQLLDHLGAIGVRGTAGRRVTLLGSSMGGTVAIELAARWPALVQRLVLCDVGPSIPAARRKRRGQAIARFYVFHTPQELNRRTGAAQKNDGPVREEIRQFISHHQTRWSDEHGGRIYGHDVRAMQAYRRDAGRDVDQWQAWSRVRCPALLLHGMESDALSLATIARMHEGHALTVAHIPQTGHTPVLSDRHQTQAIAQWLRGDPALQPGCEFSIPMAPPREVWSRVPARIQAR